MLVLGGEDVGELSAEAHVQQARAQQAEHDGPGADEDRPGLAVGTGKTPDVGCQPAAIGVGDLEQPRAAEVASRHSLLSDVGVDHGLAVHVLLPSGASWITAVR